MQATPVIAGNWKMHHGPEATRDFFVRFRGAWDGPAPTLIVFPPALSFPEAMAARGTKPEIHLGVQNVHWEPQGAFTGEVSAAMAREAGASHVLVGHSERRHLFGETDDDVARKVRAVQSVGLVPVICVGETLTERRAGRVEDVILRQLDAAVAALGEDSRFLVAYEPVWAIGTGETATPRDASEAHGALRRRLQERTGEGGAAILYGGSVKPQNAAELLAAPDVDGVLVGGASLDPDSFAAIARAAPKSPGIA